MAFKKINDVSIENARLRFRNFSGREDTYNRAGDRNFTAVIDDPEIAQQLRADGWNIKERDFEDGTVEYRLPVKVKFGDYPPSIYMITGKNRTQLTEESVGVLDRADLQTCDLIIRPYHWSVNGKEGITAYLKTGYFVLEIDEFASKYAEEEFPVEDVPFA